MTYKKLLNSIKNNSAKVAIVGVGYVGGSLAEWASKAGINTLGIDIDTKKVEAINSLGRENLKATSDISKISERDIICVCVPTPISKSKKPNLGILKKALVNVSKYLKKGQLIVIESSIAPGTTRNFALPILEKSGHIAGRDFFLSFSPERVDPANDKFNVKNTPKVVSGFDENSLKLVYCFYSSFVDNVIPVSSLEVAELTKVLENTFRLVNISLINEIAQFANVANVDIYEVISAAATKPFGFLPHYPGPGAGGDCIPVLPYFLLNSAKKHKINLRVVKSAAKVNELQPYKVAQKAIEVVNGKLHSNGHSPKVLLLGVAYKEETADIRHSPALKIWELLEESGMSVSYHDPYVTNINGYSSQKLSGKVLSDYDLFIITTGHKKIAFSKIIKSNKPVLDTKNILSNYRQSHIIRL